MQARCIDNELLMYFRGKKKLSKEVSLYEPIGTDKEGNQIQLMDVVVCEDVDIVEQMEQAAEHAVSERNHFQGAHRAGAFYYDQPLRAL